MTTTDDDSWIEQWSAHMDAGRKYEQQGSHYLADLHYGYARRLALHHRARGLKLVAEWVVERIGWREAAVDEADGGG